MKALMYLGPEKLEVREIDKPVPKEGEVLLKIKACGICGSDVHGYLGLTGRRTPPMVMGHEFSAEIESFGRNTQSNHKIGDRVTVQPVDFCGKCERCLEGYTNVCEDKRFYGVLDVNGALAEYLAVPEHLLYPLPDSMSFEEGALVETFAVAYCGVKKAGNLKGKNVLVSGGGTIGQLVLTTVKTMEPKTVLVTDLSPLRLKFAEKLGADVAFTPDSNKDFSEQVKGYLDGKLVDVSLEAVGIQPTVSQTIEALTTQGTCVWIGNSAKTVIVDMQAIVTRELTLRGTYIYTHQEFGEALAFIANNNIDLYDLVTKVVTIEEAPEIFAELAKSAEGHLKVVVKL